MAAFTGNLFLTCNNNKGKFRIFTERAISKHHVCWVSSLVALVLACPQISLSGTVHRVLDSGDGGS